MESNNGNKVANQFTIRVKTSGDSDQVAFDRVYFQSYNSIIAYIDYDGKTVLDPVYWDYSKTTGKYRNIFLGEDKKTTEKKIKEGIYTFKDLN